MVARLNTALADKQDVLMLIGRLLIAAIYILAGFGKLAQPEGTAGYMAAMGIPMASVLVWPAGLVELLGGLALALGFQARIAALALVAFNIPATFIFHAFWSADAASAQVQQIMFLKNLAMSGGLLYVAALGAGRFSVSRS